jgi:hydroxymethylpyrimidine/phosphomethylpyrimidine kinase
VHHRRTPRVLSIAGSDSGGGAGIQADLKAFARCGVHGMTAVTAITAQSTVGVVAVHAVPPEVILAQVRAVANDIGVDAVKVGMLGSLETVRAVVRALDELPSGTPVVVDPVIVAESGARLLEVEAERGLVAEIFPRATVVTPNVPEARALTGAGVADPKRGRPAKSGPEARALTGLGTTGPEDGPATEEDLAREIRRMGPAAVVVTGGHRSQAVDVFFDGDVLVPIRGRRHPDGAAHGSGCTHSSVLAARLALGDTPLEAARVARRLAGQAVGRGLRDVGRGPGPVDVLGLSRFRR